MKSLALYIHIPFCDHKCIYCDFYSVITLEKRREYLSALHDELRFYAERYSAGRKVVSIYFGGGTPSYLETEEISDILNTAKSHFNVSDMAEITLETNPGTVDGHKLSEFRSAGINRLSVGVQSFDESDLKFLTRIHDSEQAISTIETAAKSGFDNLSLDLIFNLPGQTKEKWLKNLEIACTLPITHISPYSLILERGTILNKMVLDGKVHLQDEDYDAELYETTIDNLAGKGFLQYEVSNFAKPGFECKHNLAYWSYGDYLGVGTSSHSFVDGKRWWNFSALTFYLESIRQKAHAVAGSEVLADEEKLDEFVMLALRSKGLDLEKLRTDFDGGWEDKNRIKLKQLAADGFVRIEQDKFVKFTSKGYAVCDEILATFS